MKPSLSDRALVVALIASLAGTWTASGQSDQPSRPSQTSSQPASPPRDELPVSLDRIRVALERAPESKIKLPEVPIFSILIEGRTPRIEDFIDFSEFSGRPSLPMSRAHQEFLAQVTPPEARPYGSFSSGELAVVAAQSFATGLAVGTLPALIKEAWRRREQERAKREVQAVLEELERRRSQQQ
jgi:hypothetical protein